MITRFVAGRMQTCSKNCIASYLLCCVSIVGANPNRRDRGRGLCAEQWARFCGCHNSAEAISKYIHSKKYFFKRAFLMSKDKWSSEPELASRTKTADDAKSRRDGGGGGNWIQRHLSLKRKSSKSSSAAGKKDGTGPASLHGESPSSSSVAATNRSGSAPLLITISPAAGVGTTAGASNSRNFRRPSCLDGVVPVSIVPKLRVTSDRAAASSSSAAATLYEDGLPPPTITVAGDSDGEVDPSPVTTTMKPLG